ncbi:MAG: hypothetical protein ABSA16_15055 [Thermoguttaceae bacterium]|jgi:hypothetical protein
MTIAACYRCTEGVVLGSDSTATYFSPFGEPWHFNFAQKVFEIGENSTLGVVSWGLGGFKNVSYRTLFAQLADEIGRSQSIKSVRTIAELWSQKYWNIYKDEFADPRKRCNELASMTTRNRQEDEELYLLRVKGGVGFIIGGYVFDDRTPRAFQVTFDFESNNSQLPIEIGIHDPIFRGLPNFMDRVLKGMDNPLYEAIINSGKWAGTREDLTQLVWNVSSIKLPPIPLREAIDWIYSSIYATTALS